MSPDNNMYLTIAFKIKEVPIPLTLIPLRIGSLVCSNIERVVASRKFNSISLKWPNDILAEDKKVYQYFILCFPVLTLYGCL